MVRNPGSSPSCKDHQWREGRGVCPSCLADRLFALTCATSKMAKLSKATTNTSSKPLNTDSNQTSDNLYSDVSTFSTADASFSWQRSKSQEKGRNSKEYFFDAEDDQRLCLVYFDSEVDSNSHSQGKIHKLGTDGSRKGRSRCARSSSMRLDKAATTGKKHRSLWTPSTILRKLFASTKSSMDRCTSHQHEKSDDLSAVGAIVSSATCDGSDIPRESQSSDAEKIHPVRRVIPVISTGCYDRITETMKHSDQAHRFSYQCCSKGFAAELSSRPPGWSKAMGSSPLRIFSKKSHNDKDLVMDLDRQFQGAATSWSRSNVLGEQERKLSYLSPTRTVFYKDHTQSQCSFRSSPQQARKSRRKKALESRPGIFHISPYSLGNDGFNCYLSPLAYRRNSTVKQRLN